MAVSPRVWNIVKQIPIRWWRDDVCKAEDRLLIVGIIIYIYIHI